MPHPPQAFFFLVKIKSVRESFFFAFFHGWKMAFTHTFFEFFTGGRKFSRTLFRIFSRVGFFFSREGNEKFSIIFTQGFFFHGYKKRSNSSNFMERVSYIFHAHSFPFSRMWFGRNFHVHNWCFHGQFSRFFHGRKKKLPYGNPKIVENFHGRDFDFHGEKKTL